MLFRNRSGLFRNGTDTIIGNILGSIAVLMWGFLPLLRLMAGEIPPLQLTCMSLFMASLVTFILSTHFTRKGQKLFTFRPVLCAVRRIHPRSLRPRAALVPRLLRRIKCKKQIISLCRKPSLDLRKIRVCRASCWSVVFLLGAVVFYFAALAKGPAAEVTLVTYLWPLGLSGLLCLQSGCLPSIQMGSGVLLSFGGAALALLSSSGGSAWTGLNVHVIQGYALGLASGLCWLGYSCMLKRMPADLGLHARIFACAGIGAALLHVFLENTAFHLSAAVLLAALIIGIGPYGLAFLAWGQGLRFGHPGLLSALCYSVPILATTLLVLAGMETWSPELAIAALAVACGAWMSGIGPRGKRSSTEVP